MKRSTSLRKLQEYVVTMRVSTRLSLRAKQRVFQARTPYRVQRRPVATHPYSHHAAALSILPTNVDTSSTEYKNNARQFGDVMARMQELHRKIEQGGSQKAREKHIAKGKMLPREYVPEIWLHGICSDCQISRITTLIHPGTPFLELSSLAGHEVYPGEEVPAGGIITGVGTIQGVRCMIVANDSTYMPQ